jgi:FKBP-type peptidyl-prolyl cis-trans isomerase (trigger factor)
MFDQFMEELKDTAQVAYPPLLVEQEAEAFGKGIKKELENVKITWPQYLEMTGHTEEALKEQWLADAEKRVKEHLILGEFIAQEKLTINQNDIMELLQERLSRYEDPQIRNYILSMYLEGDRGRELRNEALALKAQKRVAAIVTGQAPDLDALDEEEEEE